MKFRRRQGEVILEERPLTIAKEAPENPAYVRLTEVCETDEEDEIFEHEPLWYWASLLSLTEEEMGKVT